MHAILKQFSIRLAIVAMVAVSAIGLVCVPVRAADSVKQEMTEAVSAVRPALIRIVVASVDHRQGREVKTESAGSGVIISEDGYAVTNHHVVMNAVRIVCTLWDKREVTAQLIGTDALADISVIKLKSPDGKAFPKAEFENSSALEVGDRVFAMGCPLALSQSVTMGIVSNLEMMMPDQFSSGDMTLDGEDVGSIVKWIGHDALIEPGNSGGPLINSHGKIVGINEISFGLAGAIPSRLASSVAEQLIKFGEVRRSWIGVDVQPLLDSSKLDKGVLVSSVTDGSPAAKAGLKAGDVILSMDGSETTAVYKEQIPQFNQFVSSIPVGKTVKLQLVRGGNNVDVTLVTSARPKAIDRTHEVRGWGLCGTNITPVMQKEMQLASAEGVVVSSVLPSGPAGSAQPQLRPSDVIIRVNDRAIADISALKDMTLDILKEKAETTPVLVTFTRGEKQIVSVVKLGKSQPSARGAEITKAWLGVDSQVLTSELATALGLKKRGGVRVTQVFPGSNAKSAGLQVGDLIVTLDNEAIPADQLGDEEVLASMIRQYDIGSEVDLGLIRGGKEIAVKVKLDPTPKPSRDLPRYENFDLEFTARDIAFVDRTNGIVDDSVKGAYVESVADGSSSALAGLQAGDVILSVDSSSIRSLDDLKSTMENIAKTHPEAVVVAVKRGIRTRFIEIKPGWSESDK